MITYILDTDKNNTNNNNNKTPHTHTVYTISECVSLFKIFAFDLCCFFETVHSNLFYHSITFIHHVSHIYLYLHLKKQASNDCFYLFFFSSAIASDRIIQCFSLLPFMIISFRFIRVSRRGSLTILQSHSNMIEFCVLLAIVN